MINSYLVIKKNNVLLHYENEFDIQPIKVITPSFPLWRGQGEVKKRNHQCQTLYLITLNSESLLDIYAITVLYLKYFYGKRSKIKLIVDFYCQELKLAIEVDGHIHDFRYVEDKVRQEQIEQWGITFIRFSNEDIKTNMFSVVLSLESKIDELKKITFSEEQVANTFTQL